MRFKGFSYEDPNRTFARVAYFDGYSIAERLLEGVPFKAEITPDGQMTVNFVHPNGKYEQGLNQQKWLKEALEFAQEHDIFCENPELDGEDLVLEVEAEG